MKKGNHQSFNPDLFREAVRVSIGSQVPVQIFDAIVQAGTQDSNSMTCYVDSCDSSCSNLEVRYHLCISDGIVKVPADGSVVTVAKTAFTDPYIVDATELNSLFIGVGNQSYLNSGSIQEFKSYGNLEGSFGGFIKDVDPNDPEAGLLKALHNLQNDINNLKSILSTLLSTPILTASAGSPDLFQIALNTGLSAYLSQSIPVSTTSDLENPNITHSLSLLP